MNSLANKLFLRVDIHNESNLSTLWKKRNFRWALADEVILTGRRASNVERMARKSTSG